MTMILPSVAPSLSNISSVQLLCSIPWFRFPMVSQVFPNCILTNHIGCQPRDSFSSSEGAILMLPVTCLLIRRCRLNPDGSIKKGRIPPILGSEYSRREIMLLDPQNMPMDVDCVLVECHDEHLTYSTTLSDSDIIAFLRNIQLLLIAFIRCLLVLTRKILTHSTQLGAQLWLSLTTFSSLLHTVSSGLLSFVVRHSREKQPLCSSPTKNFF